MPAYTKGPKRIVTIGTRVTKALDIAIRRAAKAAGVTPSSWLEQAAREKLGMSEAGK